MKDKWYIRMGDNPNIRSLFHGELDALGGPATQFTTIPSQQPILPPRPTSPPAPSHHPVHHRIPSPSHHHPVLPIRLIAPSPWTRVSSDWCPEESLFTIYLWRHPLRPPWLAHSISKRAHYAKIFMWFYAEGHFHLILLAFGWDNYPDFGRLIDHFDQPMFYLDTWSSEYFDKELFD
jgi:hypothetical protein